MGLQYGKTAAGAQGPAGTSVEAGMKLSRSGIIALLIASALSLYALAGIAATEAAAGEYRQRLETLGERAAELEPENARLARELALASDSESIERAARSLGLVYPGEIVFEFSGGRDN